MKKISLLLLISVFAMSCFAQKGKFGHVDSNTLFTLMPEKEEATKNIEQYAMTLEKQLLALNEELETKYNDYTANEATYSPSIKQMKQEELVNLQQRIQTFQTQAQEDMQNKEVELLEPIYTKIQDAIKLVGEEQGLIYVFDVSTLLYFSSESVDITPLVKTKLGIQ
ncbi:MAG TPA: OmpH family outer membrane protein [Bacteroidales bacterium]|nr:OmpH family outer membrane protein [Bacteroidales bacterium]